jgi:hypothetical protein
MSTDTTGGGCGGELYAYLSLARGQRISAQLCTPLPTWHRTRARHEPTVLRLSPLLPRHPPPQHHHRPPSRPPLLFMASSPAPPGWRCHASFASLLCGRCSLTLCRAAARCRHHSVRPYARCLVDARSRRHRAAAAPPMAHHSALAAPTASFAHLCLHVPRAPRPCQSQSHSTIVYTYVYATRAGCVDPLLILIRRCLLRTCLVLLACIRSMQFSYMHLLVQNNGNMGRQCQCVRTSLSACINGAVRRR